MPTAVPLAQLVDLALGTPEVGAVNFNILHTLLHAMISKLGFEDVKADLNDYDRDFLATVIKSTSRDPYALSKLGKSYRDKTDIKDELETSDTGKSAPRIGSAGGWDKDSAKGDDSLLDDVSETSFIPSKNAAYHRLENRVAELSKVLSDLNNLPTTTELLAGVKHKAASEKPVADMWQTMQLKKRVDANEEGVGKLMQMVEDLMKELEEQREENKKLADAVKEATKFDADDFLNRLKALEKTTDELRKDLDGGLDDMKNLNDKFAALPSPEEIAQFVRWGDLEDALKGIRLQLENMNQPLERVVNVIEVVTQTEKVESRPVSAASRSSGRGPSQELLDILETLGSISAGHKKLEGRVDILEELVVELTNRPIPAPPQPEKVKSPEPEKIPSPEPDIKPEIHVYIAAPAVDDDMKNKMDKGELDNLGNTAELLEELAKLRGDVLALQQAMSKLQEMSGKDTELRSQMEDLLKKIKEDAEALARLQQMLLLLEAAIDKLNSTTTDLTDDSATKGLKIDELFALCKGLEKKKADKEYVAMEVDVKADKKQLEGKVNHNLFDSTTSEMNKTIQDILGQLSGNSDEWKNMLARLTNDLDGKLDRLELNPLKEWLEKKLKALSKKIQDGNLQWNDDEAAGLKKQLIQHYHCLSCDKPLNIMPNGMQQTAPASYGMPPSRSPRPYTTYELDQIRQHAKSFGSPEQADFYATSRQCGGHHTLTQPHQRFTRLNTFNQLFADEQPVEEIPLPVHKEEVDVMGADGHIYRGRMERLEAKIPLRMTRTPNGNRANIAPGSPRSSQRPSSARGQGVGIPQVRQSSSRGSRPVSARITLKSDLVDQQSGVTTPPLNEEEGISMEVPLQVPAVQGE